MTPSTCPNCQQPLRPGARFCAKCGTPTSAPPPPQQPGVIDKVRQSVSQAGAAAGPVVKDAAAVATPVVKDAAAKGWQVSRREMGRAASILTLGGRAAYTEIASPQSAAEGFITGPPDVAWAKPVSEPAAYAFAASWLAIWLLLALPDLWALLADLVLLVVLLVLAWQGMRRPYFSKLTFTSLWQRLRRQPVQIAELRFPLREQRTGQTLPVTVLGYDPAGALAPNTYVRVYGIGNKEGTSLRAWRVETIDQNGRLAGALQAPRLVPLTVALFLPVLLILLALIVRLAL